MADQRDIDRWKKGKDHWNKWAEGRLKAKEKLKKEGKWEVDFYGSGLNEETKNWISKASVDFSRHRFDTLTSFADFIFPSVADFNGAYFRKDAAFSSAIFFGKVGFEGASFNNEASFTKVSAHANATFDEATFHGFVYFSKAKFRQGATFFYTNFENSTFFDFVEFFEVIIFRYAMFSAPADFESATFDGQAFFNLASFTKGAEFSGATFHRLANFNQATFDAGTNFAVSRFLGAATFSFAASSGPLSFEAASFYEVPDFIQMSFHFPARLDDLYVVEAHPFLLSGDADRAARYRALKKIAVESYDHVREQSYFASEARERRGNDDPVGSPNWLFSIFYELLSDFGRSIARPIGWWLISLLLFAAVTGTNVSAKTRSVCNWQSDWLLPEIYLSFLHSLPIVGFGRGEKRNQALTCLFGDTANVSPGMDMLFILQNIWSAILIFLFLLAVRNHFRIK